MLLSQPMLDVFAPKSDSFFTFPVRDGNAQAVGAASAFNAKKTGLLLCQFYHPLGRFFIAARVGGRAKRCENDCVVGWSGECHQQSRSVIEYSAPKDISHPLWFAARTTGTHCGRNPPF